MGEWIEKEKAKHEIKKAFSPLLTLASTEGIHFMKATRAINEMKPEDVAPVVHAHYDGPCCSNCGMPISTDCWGGGIEKNNYCYYCGARMDAE